MKTIRLALLTAAALCAISTTAQAQTASWNGVYVGAHAGGAWGDFTNRVPAVVGPTGDGGNIMGGFHVGADWQVVPQFVLGLVADFSWIDISAESAASKFEEDMMMTFRARGGIPVGNFLPYLTVGFAGTGVESTLGGVSEDDTRYGLALGVGVDYALDQNWQIRTEYLHVDVPRESETVGAGTVEGGSGNNVLRLGINYKL